MCHEPCVPGGHPGDSPGEPPDLRKPEHLAGARPTRTPGQQTPRNTADVHRRSPRQNREDMAGPHPVLSPVARGGERAQLPVPGDEVQPCVGRGHHLHLDRSGWVYLAVVLALYSRAGIGRAIGHSAHG